ncbi:MAG: hypothetical protein C0P61_000120 [Bacillota bacterium]|nr:hypothetical protein [Bacillota bacterium]REJ34692.1 MAG: hypothetical protein DIU82_08590 [Bacillota bacterium]
MRCLVLIGDRAPHPALAKRLPGFVFSQDLPPEDWTCVFRWGATHGRDDGLWVVNAREAILNAIGPDAAAILRLNNIPAAPGVEPRWRVHVFDLRTLAVLQWSGRRLRHSFSGGARLLARLRNLGRRACYALGLHFGAVDIGVTSSGQLAVVRVVPAPALDARLARRWAHAMETYVAAVADACATAVGHNPGREVVLGADPEFILRSRISGRTVSASRFFSRFGTVGLDRACFMRNGVLIYPLAEVRPDPSPDPLQLVENLRRAIARAASIVRGYRINFEAGGTALRRFTIGGHVHFSNIRLTTDLLQALDNYLALPVLFLENPKSSRLRRPRYGFLGDWRSQPHGGFEYRTPGSWLISPQYAQAVLCLAKVVATDYPLLRRNVFLSLANQRAFYQADKPALRPCFLQIWRDLEQAPTFQEFRQHIELIRQMVAEERRWNERVDLKRRWLAG